ncbi:Glycopeptide antibiotics resistance protein [Streptomyces sp. MnatMP-M27]|uniref:VanZ family protein n=1 Tax=Streptomyces sp. MnatMP-M27 TaxID=1839768 RepID=UPI00081E77CF|nr:Glycopeptide antibiotics resistance protein [Streptomyces sp. MnatMP-M27]
MISIAGWEIRRTADKRTTVKRAAERKSAEGKSAEKRTAAKRTGEGSRSTGNQTKGSGKEKGARTGGGPTKGASGTAKQQAPKRQTAKPGSTKARTTKAQSTKAQSAKAQSAKVRTAKAAPSAKDQSAKGAQSAKAAQPTKGQSTKARTAESQALEPQGGPEKALLQRKSFGARVARGLVLLVAFVCMVGFAAALAKATLVPSPDSVDLVHTNLHPGRSLRTYIDQPAFRDTVKQIGGNVLLGAPFGVLLPMLVPRARGAVRVAVVTALVMVAVETVQGLIVEGRAFDIDDVILNTTGALLGYVVVGRRLGHALYPRRRHWWHRWTRRGTQPPPAA